MKENRTDLDSKRCESCKEVFYRPIYTDKGKYKYPMSITHWRVRRFCSQKCAQSRAPQDEKHGNWKGDEVGYAGLHVWVKKHLGRPKECQFCGSLNNETGKNILQWASKDGTYLRDLSQWVPLCVSCHKSYDMARIKEQRERRKVSRTDW